MSAIKPLGSHVLIRRSEAGDVSAGGIILPEAAKEQPKEGTVLAIGAGQVVDDGSSSLSKSAKATALFLAATPVPKSTTTAKH